jgi:hypothetical protein
MKRPAWSTGNFYFNAVLMVDIEIPCYDRNRFFGKTRNILTIRE